MSIKDSIRVTSLMDIPANLPASLKSEIAVVEFDLVGEKVNKFNTATMTRLKEVVQELASSKFKLIMWVSKKTKIYIAGADIDEIRSLNTPEQFEKAVLGGQEIFNMIEDLPMPSMAVINGACVGGGCEFIMACDYRIASEDPSTKIGLPEVKLGIIPGFGGCVRMPRIMGLQGALDIILQGKTVAATKAAKAGLIDRSVHPELLMEQATKWAAEIIQSGAKKRRKTFKPKGLMNGILESGFGRNFVVYGQAKKGVLKATRGHYPAPLKALDVVIKTYGMSNRARALEIERSAFCAAAMTEASKNLIHVYDLTEMVKKQTGVSDKNVKAKEVKSIGILGAGVMGGGVAFTAADKGITARMKDVNMTAVGKGVKHAQDLWQKAMKRRRLNEYEFKQKMSLVSGGVDYSGFGRMDLVVEAIVEDMEIKKKVIAETAKQMRPDAIIVTNTSSLSVTEMSKGHPRPEFFAGMHFFNPVDKMPLVEVIRGSQSSDETIATVFELAKKMGKMPVVTKDGPGFLVNRLLLPYMAEAAFLLQEGMDIKTMDDAYVNEFGMPMGPVALMDEVGLDVCIKVLKIFKKALGERIEMAPLMDKLEKSDRLGRKNGKGFYLYDSKGYRGEVDGTVYSALGLSAPSNPHTSKECIERGVFAMVNECSRALLEERIVESAAEADLAMIMGTGFPPFRGGLLKYADKLGASYICDQLEVYASKGATRLKPAPPLMNLAKTKGNFYSK